MTQVASGIVSLDGRQWVPLTALIKNSASKLPDTGVLKQWLVGNLPPWAVRKIGALLYVAAAYTPIVNTYLTHRAYGKDFRGSWSDLPDAPDLPRQLRLDLAWATCLASACAHGPTLGTLEKGSFIARSEAQKMRKLWRAHWYAAAGELSAIPSAYADAKRQALAQAKH